jgi:transposase
MEAEPALPDAAPDLAGPDPQRIEIVLPDGTALRVAEGISATALRRVLSALRG